MRRLRRMFFSLLFGSRGDMVFDALVIVAVLWGSRWCQLHILFRSKKCRLHPQHYYYKNVQSSYHYAQLCATCLRHNTQFYLHFSTPTCPTRCSELNQAPTLYLVFIDRHTSVWLPVHTPSSGNTPHLLSELTSPLIEHWRKALLTQGLACSFNKTILRNVSSSTSQLMNGLFACSQPFWQNQSNIDIRLSKCTFLPSEPRITRVFHPLTTITSQSHWDRITFIVRVDEDETNPALCLYASLFQSISEKNNTTSFIFIYL